MNNLPPNKFSKTAKILIDRHGKFRAFEVLFFMKTTLVHYLAETDHDNEEKEMSHRVNWFLNSVSEALLIEVFGEEN